MLRLFIAVTLPEEALDACARETRRVEAALGSLARGVRFPRGEGLHFTIKFLGPVPEDGRGELEAALTRAAARAPPFAVVLGGLQAFPSPRKPRVVYLGVTAGAAPMARAALAVEEEVAPLGFPTERRPFAAHVTLARVKDPRAAPKVGARLASLPPVEVARLEVRDLALMRSELSPGGSRYSALARFPLTGS